MVKVLAISLVALRGLGVCMCIRIVRFSFLDDILLHRCVVYDLIRVYFCTDAKVGCVRPSISEIRGGTKRRSVSSFLGAVGLFDGWYE